MKTVTLKRKDSLILQATVMETLAECSTSAGGENKIVEFLTMYAAQKDIFPEAYDDLVTAIEQEAGFTRASRKTATTIGGKATEVTTYVEPHKTNQDYIDDFRKHVGTNGSSKLGLDADATGAACRDWLQSVLNRKIYVMDLSAAGRTRKAKIEQVYLEGARTIIKNGSQSAWLQKFEKLEVAAGDFQTENAEENVQTLAVALRDWTIARTKNQFV